MIAPIFFYSQEVCPSCGHKSIVHYDRKNNPVYNGDRVILYSKCKNCGDESLSKWNGDITYNTTKSEINIFMQNYNKK